MISTGSVVTYLIFESCDIVISPGGIADIKKNIGTAKHIAKQMTKVSRVNCKI